MSKSPNIDFDGPDLGWKWVPAPVLSTGQSCAQNIGLDSCRTPECIAAYAYGEEWYLLVSNLGEVPDHDSSVCTTAGHHSLVFTAPANLQPKQLITCAQNRQL